MGVREQRLAIFRREDDMINQVRECLSHNLLMTVARVRGLVYFWRSNSWGSALARCTPGFTLPPAIAG
jgi:hypothetical protein